MDRLNPFDLHAPSEEAVAEVPALGGVPARLQPRDYRSWEQAAAITEVIGAQLPLIERCVAAFSRVPYAHMRSLADRGVRILFAPTIRSALESSFALARRGRELFADELLRLRFDYDKASGTVAVYDQATDLVVFPTDYTTRDVIRPVLHEVGHALTMPRAVPRSALLQSLPAQLAEYVRAATPADATPEEQLRVAPLEALAEGYVYLVEGRVDTLSKQLEEELRFLLSTSTHAGDCRFQFEEDL